MRPLNADKIVEKAHLAAAVDRFDNESYREGLEILVRDANAVAQFHDRGRDAFETQAVQVLKLRLQVEDYIRSHPDVTMQPVVAPVVVLGIPRTGTTLTSNLLGVDPARRSLLEWESNDLVPPAAPGALTTDPRARAALAQEDERRRHSPTGGRIHTSSAIFPTECTFITAQDFKSLVWDSWGRLPEYADWILECDMRSAYDHHRRVLQVLQHTNPGPWNLKMPSHSVHIRGLLQAYPDARIVWTHRDPFTASASLFSLITAAHRRALDEPDRDWIRTKYPHQLAVHANRPLAVRKEIGHDCMYDVHYADLVRDPISTMRCLYEWLGDPFSDVAEERMRQWLVENPQGKWGKHDYQLSGWDLTIEDLAPYFAEYLAEFDVELEGKGMG